MSNSKTNLAVSGDVRGDVDGPVDEDVYWALDGPDRPFLLDFLGSAEVVCTT